MAALADEAGADLTQEAVTAALGDRPVRAFVAVVSCEAEAMRWAREEGPEGAVVVGRHQIGLRDRGGTPWPVDPDRGLAFSVLLRPRLAPIKAGRLYVAGSLALLDTLSAENAAEWPDTIWRDGELAGGVVTRVASSVKGIDWSVVSLYVVRSSSSRAQLMAELIRAFEAAWGRPDADLQAAYRERCRTLGRRVRATFLPLGPRSRKVDGTALDVTPGGALLVQTEEERRVTLQIADIGKLEYLTESGEPEASAPSLPSLDAWPFGGDIVPPSGPGWTP